MKLSDKIIYLRNKNNISQLRLAKELNVSRQSVYKWEADLSIPELEKIKKMSQIFNVSYDVLLNDEISLKNDDKILDSDEFSETENSKSKAKEKTVNRHRTVIFSTIISILILLIASSLFLFIPSDNSKTDTDSDSDDYIETDSNTVQCSNHNLVKYRVDKEPTCEENGKTILVCNRCNRYDFEITKAKGHTMDNKGTCQKCGYIKGSNGIEYSIIDGYACVESYGTCEDKHVRIANRVNGYPVKVIQSSAFYGTQIEVVILPDTIEIIGDASFKNCSKLTRINLNEGLITIGIEAFSSCGEVEKLIIPDTVEMIGHRAFAGTDIDSLTLGSNLKIIKTEAFHNSGLLGIVIFKDPENWNVRFTYDSTTRKLSIQNGTDLGKLLTNNFCMNAEWFKE